MNAPTAIPWSEARFGPDTHHWLPRGLESALDHIQGDDGVPLLGTTLAQLRDPVGFIDSMIARNGKVYRAKSFGGRGVSLIGAEGNERVMFDRDKLVASEKAWGPVQNIMIQRGQLHMASNNHSAERKKKQ